MGLLFVVFAACRGGVRPSNPIAPPQTVIHDDDGASTQAPAAAAPGLGGVCHDGWCWEDPLPTGDDLADVVAISKGDAWIAAGHGAGTTLLHWNDSDFVRSEIARHVSAFTRAGGALWAATREGAMLRLDGGEWRDVDTHNAELLTSAWGSGPNDVWAVGAAGTILRFDGKAWSKVRSPVTTTLWGVRGRAPNDVWAVGDGVIVHWNGADWSVAHHVDKGPMERPIPRGGWCGTPALQAEAYNTSLSQMRSILVFGADDVWVAGGPGRALHLHGGKWSEVDLGMVSVQAMWGTPTDAWAAGTSSLAHWDGKKWTRQTRPLDESVAALSGVARDDVWAVGHLGAILRFDGAEWRSLGQRTGVRLNGVWPGADGEAWAAAGGAILRRSARGWAAAPIALPANANVNSVGGASGADLWAFVAFHAPMRWDGHAWTTPPGQKPILGFSVRAPATDDVWAVGSLSLARWDGGAWRDLSNGELLVLDLWAPAKGVAWAVAHPRDPSRGPDRDGHVAYDYGKVVLARWDGAAFVRVADVPDPTVHGIGGLGTEDVWLAGGESIFRFDGRTLKAIVPASAADRTYRERRVAAVSKDDVWIAGQGDVRHWDGRAWTVFDLPIANPTLAVRGKDVYASGTYGGILKKQ